MKNPRMLFLAVMVVVLCPANQGDAQVLPPPPPEISVVIDASSLVVYSGDVVTLTICVGNSGGVLLTNPYVILNGLSFSLGSELGVGAIQWLDVPFVVSSTITFQVYAHAYANGELITDFDSVTVICISAPPPPPNQKPVADAGEDQTVSAVGGIAPFTLDGSGSYDPDGDPLTYEWTWTVNGISHSETGVNPTITLPFGDHTITLVVNDGTQDSDPDDVVMSFGAMLMFREGTGLSSFLIPYWDHVGFFPGIGDKVWESHIGYPAGSYHDPLTNVSLPVAKINGTQAVHTIGSYLWNSTDPGVSGTTKWVNIEIDPSVAAGITSFIGNHATAGFSDFWLGGIIHYLHQKGLLGEFSCCGLIEAGAESIYSFHIGEGFIPNAWEMPNLTQLHWGLTPSLLKHCVENEDTIWGPSPGPLSGIAGSFDPVDFILTDPLGRRLGHVEGIGTFDEIPNAMYSGDGDYEFFLFLDRVPGEYHLELYGVGSDYEGAIYSLGSDSMTVIRTCSGYLEPGERVAQVLPAESIDIDGDGVPDNEDDCPGTPTGELADPIGCALCQYCPCDGSSEGEDWENHGQYINCVARTAEVWLESELITEDEKDEIISWAAQSDCGKAIKD